MEVGAAVWVKDKDGEEAWVAGIVIEKSAGKPCKVEIEVDEEFSEEPLSFTFSEDDGETTSERVEGAAGLVACSRSSSSTPGIVLAWGYNCACCVHPACLPLVQLKGNEFQERGT